MDFPSAWINTFHHCCELLSAKMTQDLLWCCRAVTQLVWQLAMPFQGLKHKTQNVSLSEPYSLISSHRQHRVQSLTANGPRWPAETFLDEVKPKQTTCPTPLSAGFNQTFLSATLKRVYIWFPLSCRGWFITAGIKATPAANSQALCGSRLPET